MNERFSFEYRGLKFSSFKSLLQLLGYNASFSMNHITNKYGNLDNMVMKRLNLKSQNEIVPALKILINNFYKNNTVFKVNNTCVLSVEAKAIIKTLLTKNINDKNVYIDVLNSFGYVLLGDKDIQKYQKEIEKFLKEF